MNNIKIQRLYMGIKGLNRFFKDNASTVIKLISLAELSGKR